MVTFVTNNLVGVDDGNRLTDCRPTSVAVNDVFAFNINSISTLNSISIALFVTTN